MDNPSYKSNFANVNGIRLHYLDWGGNGETLLFLTGMGCSAHLFHPIATRFTDKFRVLALTRRGQGESDYPETGYDPDTLVDDIYDFLAFHKIEKVILAGHSIAGIELTNFTKKYPDRVLKLIYMDAVYDTKGRFELIEKDSSQGVLPPEVKDVFESVEEYIAYVKHVTPYFVEVWNEEWDKQAASGLIQNAQGKFVEKDTSLVVKQLVEGAKTFDPSQTNIEVPVLLLDAWSQLRQVLPPDFYTEEQKKLHFDFWKKLTNFRKKEMQMFINDIPQAKVIEIRDGHHFCFIAQEELVYDEMNKFLQAA